MLKKIFFCAALFWTGVILFFCLINANKIRQIAVPNFDKVIHAGFHFVFTALWFLFLKKKLNSVNSYRPLLLSLVLSFFFGILIELMQRYFTVTRNADVLDVVADVAGSLVVVLLVFLLNKYNGVVDKI
ncbi:VanZ family protein [Flavobacterium eburneipallidum]|uniref:VanZ family protein n=1 Tax=Flavobacterium eburneipallidum TaxID=3003263 RepID=UPI0022AC3984|nr:VanZ family protein [Flavobacterium eburneipallidum]